MAKVEHYFFQLGKRALRGSTLMEALVAMFILVTISSLVFLSLARINRNTNVGLRVRATYTVNDLFYISLKEREAGNYRYDYPNFSVQRIAKPLLNQKKTSLLKVVAKDKQGRLLAEKKCIIVDTLFMQMEEEHHE